MTRSAMYPGTFDPITNGHIDIAGRAAKMFDRVVIAIAANPGKAPLFTLEQRIALARTATAHIPNIEVTGYAKLTVEFARENGLGFMLRGLRAVSDFEFEFQLANMSRHLAPDIETVFLMASETQQFISSRFVKEIALLGGNVSSFVAPRVLNRLQTYLSRKQGAAE